MLNEESYTIRKKEARKKTMPLYKKKKKMPVAPIYADTCVSSEGGRRPRSNESREERTGLKGGRLLKEGRHASTGIKG